MATISSASHPTIGADPEFFLRDKRTGGVVPAVGLLGGTKARPVPMEGLPRGFAMQEDNVMGEFNVPPSRSGEALGRATARAVNFITGFLGEKAPHLELDYGFCSRLFGAPLLHTAQAREFGCSPDFDAYAEGAAVPTVSPESLRPPDSETDDQWRFSGGHMHIGYGQTDAVPPWAVARFCDLYLGLPSTALDVQGPRRAVYGQAGRYRPKPYGIEYRTLSNFWVWEADLATEIGFRATTLGYMLSSKANLKVLNKAYTEIPWPEVQAAISMENPRKASDLLSFVHDELRLEVL